VKFNQIGANGMQRKRLTDRSCIPVCGVGQIWDKGEIHITSTNTDEDGDRGGEGTRVETEDERADRSLAKGNCFGSCPDDPTI
jgi:hypothetical protein